MVLHVGAFLSANFSAILPRPNSDRFDEYQSLTLREFLAEGQWDWLVSYGLHGIMLQNLAWEDATKTVRSPILVGISP